MNGPVISQKRAYFSLTCRVEITINTSSGRVWDLLTDAANFGRWNSTITRVEGRIAEGERLRLHVPGTTRIFTPRVSGVVSRSRMTWTGGIGPIFKGARTFELREHRAGSTDFAMAEHFSGLLLPLVKRSLPDFRPIFTCFANDLKRAAEGT